MTLKDEICEILDDGDYPVTGPATHVADQLIEDYNLGYHRDSVARGVRAYQAECTDQQDFKTAAEKVQEALNDQPDDFLGHKSRSEAARILIDEHDLMYAESTVMRKLSELSDGKQQKTCGDVVKSILESDEFKYHPKDSNSQIARRIKQNYDVNFQVDTIASHVGTHRTSQNCQWGYQTWDEWAEDESQAHSRSTKTYEYLDQDYYYNEHDDKYVIFPPNRTGSLIVPGSKYRAIREDYSDWTGDISTINEICRTHGISRRDFIAIKGTFGFTHDSSPFSDEQLKNKDNTIEGFTEDLARMREREIEKAWQKKQWRKTERKARKWEKFTRDVLRPVYESITSTPIERPDYWHDRTGLDDFILVPHCCDGHIDQLNADGTGLEENKKRWLECIFQNVKHAEQYGKPRKIVLPLGNDQSNDDGPHNQTSNGTPQQPAVTGPTKTFRVLDAGIEAINICKDVAPVEVRVIPGNHDYRTCEAYYWGLTYAMEGVEDVTVAGGCHPWQFSREGANLMGYTHGDRVRGGETNKNANLSAITLQHANDLFTSDLSHFFFVLAHLHFLLEKDDGVHTLQGPSSSKNDEYHERGKYNGKSGQVAYLFADDGGQPVRFKHDLDG